MVRAINFAKVSATDPIMRALVMVFERSRAMDR